MLLLLNDEVIIIVMLLNCLYACKFFPRSIKLLLILNHIIDHYLLVDCVQICDQSRAILVAPVDEDNQ